jgi:hypothetical protein
MKTPEEAFYVLLGNLFEWQAYVNMANPHMKCNTKQFIQNLLNGLSIRLFVLKLGNL